MRDFAPTYAISAACKYMFSAAKFMPELRVSRPKKPKSEKFALVPVLRLAQNL